MKVAISSLFRDEARYLKEFIEFHKIVGVSKFYLTNNCSLDNYMEVLQPYIDDGTVSLNIDPDKSYEIMNIQNRSYEWACSQAIKDGFSWVALINMDEFLYPIQKDTLQEVLEDFEDNVGQISVNWQMFGHSNKALAPGELQTEHLTLTQDTDLENRHVKSIVRPEAVKSFTNAHYTFLHDNYISVNTHKQPREISGPPWPDWDLDKEYHIGPFDLPVRKDVMILNHYTMRDLSFSDQKCGWYRKFGYAEDYIQWLRNRANDVENTVIHKYLPELKERMNGL